MQKETRFLSCVWDLERTEEWFEADGVIIVEVLGGVCINGRTLKKDEK